LLAIETGHLDDATDVLVVDIANALFIFGRGSRDVVRRHTGHVRKSPRCCASVRPRAHRESPDHPRHCRGALRHVDRPDAFLAALDDALAAARLTSDGARSGA
jgi:hypothetical protein